MDGWVGYCVYYQKRRRVIGLLSSIECTRRACTMYSSSSSFYLFPFSENPPSNVPPSPSPPPGWDGLVLRHEHTLAHSIARNFYLIFVHFRGGRPSHMYAFSNSRQACLYCRPTSLGAEEGGERKKYDKYVCVLSSLRGIIL